MINVIYFVNPDHGQQLFSRLLEIIPDAAQLEVGNLKRADGIAIDPSSFVMDADLVLAPNEFDFKPDANAIAYLRSLVKVINQQSPIISYCLSIKCNLCFFPLH